MAERWGILLAVGFVLLAGVGWARGGDAFPSAEGFGALATGGRGGEVVHVTTTADAGPGSLREAVSQPRRIVVFDVSGVIELKSNLAICGDITVAGQSAPGEGISVYGRSVSLSGQHNIILRYLRCREGIHGDRGKCSINMADVHNAIIDHCSVEWGRWDCLDLTKGSSDVTFQYCIIGESVDPQRFGALVDSVERITFHHNLWIHNQSRNPKAKGTIQYVNNVVYDWGITGLAGGHSGADHYLDAVGNCLIKGPSSNDQSCGGFTATDHVYQTGNLVDLGRKGVFQARPLVETDFRDKEGSPTFESQPHLQCPVPVSVQSASDAYTRVIAQAGDSLHRDAIDDRLIDELKSNGLEGKIIHSEAEIGGQPAVSADASSQPVSAGDDIPRAWKMAHHLDPSDTHVDREPYPNGGGYTVIEVYLNELADRSK